MRVLIATITMGGGHLQAAAALKEAWLALRPDDVVEQVDMFDYISKFARKFYSEGYVKLIEHAPELYAMMFKKTDDAEWVKKASNMRRKISHGTNKGFVKKIQEFQPDVIISTHYQPAEVVGALREKSDGPHAYHASIVTDFEAHALWIESSVDLYCVAADETKASLAGRGVEADAIAVTGIPIGGRFAEKLNVKAIRKRFGLRDDLPTVLVLSGGFGMGPVAEILSELDKVESDFQTMVVTGRNAELRKEIAGQDRKHPTDVLGFVTNMHELMAVSDIIVTKPGGLTTSEALALGKPLFIINPIPGQEMANSDFLLEHGAALKVNRTEDVSARINGLLGSEKLKEMSAAAKGLGKPTAAKAMCKEILKRIPDKKP